VSTGPAATAAFFDLDRTIVSGASAQVVSRALRDAGLGGRSIPGEGLVFEIFSRFGENLPSMVLGRQAVLAMKGRSQQAVRAAAATAVPELLTTVLPYARSTMEMHRAEGRRVVLATTSPVDLIADFARAVGFDDVIGTRWSVDSAGNYDGELDGPYTWSKGKLTAVRQWCADHGVDLGGSWAYSDSIYDQPLLEAVGHPNAVNPDVRLAALAAARRWPVLHFDVPEGVAKVPGVNLEVQRLALALCRPEVFPFARFEITGVEHIPRTGAALLCGNHRSYFDVVAIGMAVARSGRTVRFLGKKEVFDAPVIGPLATALGGIRVDRGTGSNEPLRAAEEALAAGDMVALMPQGTIPRGRAFFDPVLKGRWGAARLAQVSGAPVIPVGIWGTEKVWPRNAKLPNITNVTSPPDVSVTVGGAVALGRTDLDADTTAIMTAITALLPEEARVWREPTEDELRRALPSNYRGDLDAEDDRRPGFDA